MNRVVAETRAGTRNVLDEIGQAARSIDVDAVVRAWTRVAPRLASFRRRLPVPPFVERGFEHSASEAWSELATQPLNRGPSQAMSAYVHLPFCDRRCAFCDCHTIRMRPERREPEERYFQALMTELDLWSEVDPLAGRPLTTVHFGGGTPTYFAAERFECFLTSMRDQFMTTPATEWSVESTSSQINDDYLERLWSWGITRLHIGMQSLDDPVRRVIGRLESSTTVLKKIDRALELGFIVSVDLIYGLPFQSMASYLRDLERTTKHGVHGVSLFQLNWTNRNAAFGRKYSQQSRNSLREYLMFQIGELYLTNRGYRKNHFAHFAVSADRNLYTTHVVRGEDLLALGMTADGIFGDYRYRHGTYREYLDDVSAGGVGLEGGLRETSMERTLRPASASLMSGRIAPETVREIGAEATSDRWLAEGMLREAPDGTLELTGNGSWFVNDMIGELAAELRRAEHCEGRVGVAASSGPVSARARDLQALPKRTPS